MAVIEPIRFTVPGEPVAQGRPRFSTQHGFVRAYDPRKSSDYKTLVRTFAIKSCTQRFLGAVEMSVDIYRSIPKSWSKKKRELANSGLIKPTLKPDVDNYVKGIKDALNGVCYVDDSQVVVLFIAKHYSFEPRVEIVIKEDRHAPGED